MTSIALVVLTATAFATEAEADADAGARVYGSARGSLAVPAGYPGLATGLSAEVGAQFKGGQSLGLRFAMVPNPPAVLGKNTPEFAMGPAVVWTYHIRASSQLDISPTVGLGAVFGASPVDQTNQVLPYLQGGLGLRYRVPMSTGGEFYIMPEAGLVPAILAPMVGVSVGILGAPPAKVPAA
ncbi:MAG: hypothetical protein FJ102_21420 [Deltaproteobacteria bacterium]|nr:hypothetical protein [Deltaproteobacteria bacterium]